MFACSQSEIVAKTETTVHTTHVISPPSSSRERQLNDLKEQTPPTSLHPSGILQEQSRKQQSWAFQTRQQSSFLKQITTNLQPNEVMHFVTVPVDNGERWHITLGPPWGGLILPGHHGHPQMPSVTPSTHCVSLSLSVAVTHADEMFFNTQSTVLTSPWVAGFPLEGRKGIDFGWGRWSAAHAAPSPAAIIVRLAAFLQLPGQRDVTWR